MNYLYFTNRREEIMLDGEGYVTQMANRVGKQLCQRVRMIWNQGKTFSKEKWIFSWCFAKLIVLLQYY